ncbi:MAG: glycosyltransferase, partial [Bacillota bacterium]|nr:glycosyltransferase [Bacillota bacterium]
MKIAFIITRADDLGGAQIHVISLAGALQERGHEVTVLAGLGGTLFESLVLKGVSCRLLTRLIHPISLLEDWMALKEIKAILSELKPDLVTTHSNKAGLLGRMAA